MKQLTKYLLIIVLIIPTLLIAQNIEDISKVQNTITIDGILNETDWKNAYEINEFKQIEPNLGANATEKAVVKVIYDEQNIYIGVTSYFKDPSQIFATTIERDSDQTKDDFIEVHLDTYNDKINTLVFRVNPLSAREDYEISRNGGAFNISWNTFWDAKSKINDDGWSTEIKIPFSSLRYNKSEENIMRIKAIIKYKAKNERIISPLNNIEIDIPQYHFSNSQEVKFKNLPSNKALYITPYTKASFIKQNLINEDGTAYESETSFLERKNFVDNEVLDKTLSNVGLDIKYKPNANQTIDFTLNTDFAQVEADDRIINISRFPIFLPEKRLFFLENADLFNSNQGDHRLFNSRRIGIENGQAIPIIGGLRLTGNSSKWQYGVLSMQTQKVEGIAQSNNMSVARLRKSIGTLGSSIGLINTNKINNEDNNHLLAIDANIRLSNIILTKFTAGATFDKQKGNWKPMYSAEINTFKPNGFGFNYKFREYTENFSPELGFVSRPNTKRLTTHNIWRKTYTNPKFFRLFTIGHFFTKSWMSSTGQQELMQSILYISAAHKNGYRFLVDIPAYREDNLYQDWSISNNIIIPVNRYGMWNVRARVGTGRTKAYRYDVDMKVGEFYGGNQFTVNYNFSYDFNKLFKAELGGTFNQLRFPESYVINNASQRLNLSRYFTRLKFNFSSKTALNTYLQYDTSADQLGLNLRFRYNPIEGTDLYLVYNHNANTNRDLLNPRLPFTNSQVFIVKFSKTFLK